MSHIYSSAPSSAETESGQGQQRQPPSNEVGYSVFVYGTLKPGHSNYFIAEPFVVSAQEARVYGKLVDLSAGYPAVIDGNDVIHGYLLNFIDDNALKDLDELEGYVPTREPSQNLYYRESADIFDTALNPIGTAWIYKMQPQSLDVRNGVYVESGIWNPPSCS
jgi:gamma-glutamylcyclotransferase (GGCT)/AIG2-like uncharacterized protein YtfP